jgi:capsular polysaccharide biosynthesis protein
MGYIVKPNSYDQLIDYKLPLNFQKSWSHKFEFDEGYKKVKLGVQLLKNVFVNHYGLVIKNGLLVKGCAPNIGHINYKDDNFYNEHWRKASEQWLVSKFGKSIPSIKLDDNTTYLVVHSPWFSYYFWITECLPRLLMTKQFHEEVVLIYPENWKDISYVNETLALFPSLKKVIIPSDNHLFVKKLMMPEVKPWTPIFVPELILEVKDLLQSNFLEKVDSENSEYRKGIYISRKGTIKKNFVDESLVENIVAEYGFDTVAMENFSFKEQINVINRSNSIIGITGAGLINQIFLNPKSNLIDITNIGYLNSDIYKFHYWKLSCILSLNYVVQFCEHENTYKWPNFSFENLIPDIEELKKNLSLTQK